MFQFPPPAGLDFSKNKDSGISVIIVNSPAVEITANLKKNATPCGPLAPSYLLSKGDNNDDND